MNKNTPVCKVYVLVGCPGSGKSTWAKKHFGYGIVSRDAIRFSLLKEGEGYFSHEDEVYSQFIANIQKAAAECGYVVVDATHLNRPSRSKLFYSLDATFGKDNFETVFVYFNTPLATCLQRNAQRTGREKVPEDALEHMYNKTTAPRLNEHPSVTEIWEVVN